MRTEIQTEVFTHPTAGEITRTYIYTYDDSVVPEVLVNKEFYDPNEAQRKEEAIGDALIKELTLKFKEQVAAGNLNNTDKIAIINKIATIMITIKMGWLDAASVLCAASTINASYTQVRKDYLQGKIDEAIVELNA